MLAFACFADAPVDVAVRRGRHGRRVGLDQRRRRPGRRLHADRPRPHRPARQHHRRDRRDKAGIIKPGGVVVSAAQPVDAAEGAGEATELNVPFRSRATTSASSPARSRSAASWSPCAASPAATRSCSCRSTATTRRRTPRSRSRRSSRSSAAAQAIAAEIVAEGLGAVTSPGPPAARRHRADRARRCRPQPARRRASPPPSTRPSTSTRSSSCSACCGQGRGRHRARARSRAASHRIRVTQSNSDRAVPAEELADIAVTSARRGEHPRRRGARDALDGPWARRAAPSRRRVVVTGSITLVGDARILLERRPSDGETHQSPRDGARACPRNDAPEGHARLLGRAARSVVVIFGSLAVFGLHRTRRLRPWSCSVGIGLCLVSSPPRGLCEPVGRRPRLGRAGRPHPGRLLEPGHVLRRRAVRRGVDVLHGPAPGSTAKRPTGREQADGSRPSAGPRRKQRLIVRPGRTPKTTNPTPTHGAAVSIERPSSSSSPTASPAT